MELKRLKLLIEAFRSAKKLEIFLVIAAACALLVCTYGSAPGNTVSTDEEKRLERILSQLEGAGRVQVMLSGDGESSGRGAIVVAAGAEEIKVRLQLQQAVHTLTGLELNRIEVVESKR